MSKFILLKREDEHEPLDRFYSADFITSIEEVRDDDDSYTVVKFSHGISIRVKEFPTEILKNLANADEFSHIDLYEKPSPPFVIGW